MKDLKHEIKIVTGMLVLAIVAVTGLGINKLNNMRLSSAAQKKEVVQEEVLESVPKKTTLKTVGKKKVAIDAGHQLYGDSSTEPVGPGASTKKAKVSGGATGVATGVPEYKLNLDVAKKLRKELIDRGYEVYMIRSKNDVNISNKKRAIKANKSGADIYIRIHGDSSESSSVSGASALYPSKSNSYVSKLSKKSYKLSKAIIDSYCEETGIKNRGCIVRDDLTGTNWSQIPVTLIEMGFMSNSTEDKKMQKKSFQNKMAKGIADGIDAYFGY